MKSTRSTASSRWNTGRERFTQEDYRSYEHQLGQMDDQLGAAKDQLEHRLGIDD